MATKPNHDPAPPEPFAPTEPAAPPASKEIPAGGGSTPDPDYVDDPLAHLRNLPGDRPGPATPGAGMPTDGPKEGG